MSTPPDQLKPENLKRDEWMRRNLGFQAQQETVDTQVSALLRQTKPDPEEVLEGGEDERHSRKVLMERLVLLKLLARQLAAIAAPTLLLPVTERIEQIAGLIDQKKWRTAHGALIKANQLVDEQMVLAKGLRTVQLRIADVTLALDRVATKLLPDELEPLDDALNRLDRELQPGTVEATRNELARVELAIETARLKAEERLGRLKVLHLDRERLLQDIAQMASDAESLLVDAVIKGTGQQTLALQGLDQSQDVTALEQALNKAGDLVLEWKPLLAKAEHEVQVKQWTQELADLAEEGRQLREQHATLLEEAVEDLAAELGVDQADKDLAKALKALPDSSAVVDEGRRALDVLRDCYDSLDEEMTKIGVLQSQYRPRLLKVREDYPPDEDDEDRPNELDEAYEALDESLRDPDAAEWSRLALWGTRQDWEYWTFLAAYAKKQKTDIAETEREQFQEMKTRYPGVLKKYTDERKQARGDQVTAGDQLKKDLDALLLPDKNKAQRLTTPQYKQVEKWFTEFAKLVAAIKVHFADQRKKAVDLDSADGAHSVARHGPEVADKSLQKRLKTGITPEGKFSPAEKSCKFLSYDLMLETREAAFNEAASVYGLSLAALFGAKLDQAPDPNHVQASRRRTQHVVSMGHGKAIGSGFKGKGPGTPVGDPSKGGQTFADFEDLPPLTRTKSTLVWDNGKGRWVAAQHFPTDV